jgi:hypothetical protein
MEIKPFKIYHLDNEQSKIVQNMVFRDGGGWGSSLDKDLRMFSPSNTITLCMTSKGMLRSGVVVTQSTFDGLEGEELTYDQFKEKYANTLRISREKILAFAEYYTNNIVGASSPDDVLTDFLKL